MSGTSWQVGDWVEPVQMSAEQATEIRGGKVGRVINFETNDKKETRYHVAFPLSWMIVNGKKATPWLTSFGWFTADQLARAADPTL